MDERVDTTTEPEPTIAKSGATIPPYVPFSTFRGLLQRMKEEGRPPDVIDRSYLSGMSGGYQSQVMAALKAYWFVEDDGRPTKDLEQLLKNPEDEWPSVLHSHTAWLYARAYELADRHGTQGQLEKLFREDYDFSGSTLRKAIKFFLDVSKFADLPLSPHWKTPSRASIPPVTKRPRKAKVPPTTTPQASRPSGKKDKGVSQSEDTQEVALDSGGVVSLKVSVDLFRLSDRDRSFVFDLIDRLRSYEGGDT
jgi:hypothetical protein